MFLKIPEWHHIFLIFCIKVINIGFGYKNNLAVLVLASVHLGCEVAHHLHYLHYLHSPYLEAVVLIQLEAFGRPSDYSLDSFDLQEDLQVPYFQVVVQMVVFQGVLEELVCYKDYICSVTVHWQGSCYTVIVVAC